MKIQKLLLATLLIFSITITSCTPEELETETNEVVATGDDTAEDIDDEKD